jgi:hypothetical protein
VGGEQLFSLSFQFIFDVDGVASNCLLNGHRLMLCALPDRYVLAVFKDDHISVSVKYCIYLLGQKLVYHHRRRRLITEPDIPCR